MKLLATLAGLLLVSPAHAIDYDNKWIKKTIRQGEHRHVHKHERRHYAPRPKPRVYHEPRHHHAPKHVEPERPRGTSVISYGPARVERDALSNVMCMPETSAISHEFSDAETACEEAMRHWENVVRWRYGERFADAKNSDESSRKTTHGKSRSPESLAGKVTEAVRGKYMQRCEFTARPCMAPAIHGLGVRP